MRIDIDPEVLRYRRTKIVATLGPSSRDSETIAELVRAGVNVFRLNFSHGSHDEHRETYRRLRAAPVGDAGRKARSPSASHGP